MNNRIKEIRTLLGMNQKQLASKANMAQQTLARWEKGNVKLSKSKIRNIADILEVDATLLLSPPPPTRDLLTWVVYLPKKAKESFSVKLSKDQTSIIFHSKKNKGAPIKLGDTVYIASGLIWPSESGPIPKGFPRVKPDIETFDCILEELKEVLITSNGLFYTSSVASGEESSRLEFQCEILTDETSLRLNKRSMTENFISSIMRSVCSKGNPINIHLGKSVKCELPLVDLYEPTLKEDGKYMVCEPVAKYQSGSLVCDVCSFSFEKVYGISGYNLLKTYNKNPLLLTERASDTAILCPNCVTILTENPKLSFNDLKHSFLLRNI